MLDVSGLNVHANKLIALLVRRELERIIEPTLFMIVACLHRCQQGEIRDLYLVELVLFALLLEYFIAIPICSTKLNQFQINYLIRVLVPRDDEVTALLSRLALECVDDLVLRGGLFELSDCFELWYTLAIEQVRILIVFIANCLMGCGKVALICHQATEGDQGNSEMEFHIFIFQKIIAGAPIIY